MGGEEGVPEPGTEPEDFLQEKAGEVFPLERGDRRFAVGPEEFGQMPGLGEAPPAPAAEMGQDQGGPVLQEGTSATSGRAAWRGERRRR